MRIAFVRSIDVKQASPYLMEISTLLSEEKIEAKLFYTDGNCSNADFPGESVKLSPAVRAAELTALLRDWNADAVVSLSIPDENALRDALLKSKLESDRGRVIAHSADTTCTFANKWSTKTMLGAFDIATSPGFLVDGDLLNHRAINAPAYVEHVKEKCLALGFPLVFKPLWECLGNGIAYVNSVEELDAYLAAPYDGNVVVEKCLLGDLVSMEVIGESGDYVFQPSIWKGKSSSAPRIAFSRIMRNPCDVDAVEGLNDLKGNLVRLFDECRVCGALEVEMIYIDGTFYVLEINPRVSGSTSLFITMSGFNTYGALVGMARGRWRDHARQFKGRQFFGIQFPFLGLKESGAEPASPALRIVRASTFVIDGIARPNAIVQCAPAEIPSVPEWLDSHFRLTDSTIQEISEVVNVSAPKWRKLSGAEYGCS